MDRSSFEVIGICLFKYNHDEYIYIHIYVCIYFFYFLFIFNTKLYIYIYTHISGRAVVRESLQCLFWVVHLGACGTAGDIPFDSAGGISN